MRKILLQELVLSARVSDGHEVVLRVGVITPEGHWTILVLLFDDPAERTRRFNLFSGFMTWKLANGFIIRNELYAPDAMSGA